MAPLIWRRVRVRELVSPDGPRDDCFVIRRSRRRPEIVSSSLPQQVVLVLDVFGRAPEAEVILLLPKYRRSLQFLYLLENLDAELARSLKPGEDLPFAALASGVSALVQRARAAVAGNDRVEWYVYGQAPLPLFALLGFQLSAWAKPVAFLNRRKDGTWDQLALDSSGPASPLDVFKVSGTDTEHEATGRVAVFVSVMKGPAPRRAIRNYFSQRGEDIGGLVEVRTATPSLLTSENAARAAQQLAEAFSSLGSAYPNALARGTALFIAGPASLAFLSGRSVNPTIIRETLVPHFVSGDYRDAVVLPIPDTAARPLDESPEAKVRRREMWGIVREALTALQQGLKPDHLCDANPLVSNTERFVAGVREIRFPTEPSSETFALMVLERRLELGDPILDALLEIDRNAVGAVAQHLLIHEFIHDFQNLTHANFRNIGRAAVALEEIDFWADSFTVNALARMRAEATGGAETLRDHVVREIDHVILGIETFDRAEQGTQIGRLYERRLRRYLTWHLQRARAATLQSDADAAKLLTTRVIAELAPLAGHLDARYEKLVTIPLSEVEFVAVCDSYLMRFPKSANLDPGDLVQYVRTFQHTPIREFMRRVVTEARNVLAPWATL